MVHIRVRSAKAAHRDHLYLYPLKLAIDLDPDMTVENMTYVFIVDTGGTG